MAISSTFPLRTVFGFVSSIKKDLAEIQALHNQHHMRAYPLRKCPLGRPELIYNFPEGYGMFLAYIIPCDQIEIPPKLMKKKIKSLMLYSIVMLTKLMIFQELFKQLFPWLY